MRLLALLTLVLSLFTPLAQAAGLYQIEVIVFRQAGEQVPASQLAPDDWSIGSQALAAGSERGTALNGEAAKLIPANGYQVLLHQAWSQNLSASPSTVALTAGNQSFGHYPLEGTLSLSEERLIDLGANLWVNQFDAEGILVGSEQLKQSTRIATGKLTYVDHGSLGMLIRVNSL